MLIIGVDYHPSFQTIAFLKEETGECGEQELNHRDGQAERFYRELQQRGVRVRVPWASRRRKELLELLDQLDPKIAELTAAVEQEAKQRPEVLRLMTHPGVGPVTGLAYVQVIGTPERFPCGKQIGSYIGLIPCEDSRAGKQRLGHLSKQGHALLRYLLGAAQAAVRCNPHWRRRYMHLAMRRHKNIAKAAMARKLAVRLYWMWRNGWDYSQLVRFGSHAGKLVTGHGVK